ncbi:MAG: hypothetical protein ACRETB_04915 [Steroidobacteraceae bacterium]
MEAMRARADERLRQGRLPRVKAVRTWGGLGTGLPCALCDAAILSSEPEFELEFGRAPSEPTVRLHRECHSVWNEAREAFEPAKAWHPAAEELPPRGALVEARVSLSGTRSIILSVICLKVPPVPPSSEPGHTWINATTQRALPDGWCAMEWRFLGGENPQTSPERSDCSFPRRA